VAVSAQRRRRALVAVVAALIAAGAFYLAMEYTGKTPAATGGGANPTAAAIPDVTVVEASSTIASGDPLTAADLTTKPVPQDLMTILTTAGGADFTTVASLTATKHYASTTIFAGLPILSSMVTTSAASLAPAAAGLPAVLPSGYVAVSLPYTPGSSGGSGEGTGGYIQALDRVDILVYNPAGNTLSWAYQKALVLAIGEETGGVPAPTTSASASGSGTGTVETSALLMVELPAQDAAALTTAADAGDLIQYLIVSSNDYPSAGASPVPGIGSGPTSVSGATPNAYYGG
jgi:Flp pilus assembly protein CpaB